MTKNKIIIKVSDNELDWKIKWDKKEDSSVTTDMYTALLFEVIGRAIHLMESHPNYVLAALGLSLDEEEWEITPTFDAKQAMNLLVTHITNDGNLFSSMHLQDEDYELPENAGTLALYSVYKNLMDELFEPMGYVDEDYDYDDDFINDGKVVH